MNKLDYFIYGIKKDLYLERGWLLSCFGIVANDSTNEYFTIKDKKMIVRIDNSGISIHDIISDFKFGTPLFDKDEKCTLLNNILPIVDKSVNTTYGIAIINCIMLLYPYGGKVGFINSKITPNMLNDIAYELLKNNKCTVAEHIKFENAASMLTCLSQVSVPSATRKSITPNPAARKLKKQLVEENKERMDDPTTIANIQKQLIEADKEYLKGDDANGFLISKKSWNVVRLKTMGMYGAEPDFYDESKLSVMDSSLTEGWNRENLQMLINNLRGGVYGRGKETALGGESTKVTSRIFQNYKIDIDDCNTTLGLQIRINAVNYKSFIGRYLVGNMKPLDEKELSKLMQNNSIVNLRSPGFCKAEGTSYCKRCFGDGVSNSGMGLNSQSIIATSTFMAVSMAAMHSKELTVNKYEYKDRIG